MIWRGMIAVCGLGLALGGALPAAAQTPSAGGAPPSETGHFWPIENGVKHQPTQAEVDDRLKSLPPQDRAGPDGHKVADPLYSEVLKMSDPKEALRRGD